MAGHDGGAGLTAAPFRAMRYDLDAVGGDLGPVLCPPYDVVSAQGRARLLAAHPLNLVRLTLPTARDPAAAARRLHAWLADGVLRVDPEPSLTVVELDGGGGPVRGIVGVVPVDDPAGGWLLPHEDVVEPAVAERASLLDATGADLEPILLTVRGGVGDLVDAALDGPPSLSAQAAGLGLRLWTLPGEAWAAPVAEALAGRRALVADGHHRLAAARRHRRLRRAAQGPGPWDGVLALVVDADRRPLHLGAIHRHVDLPLPALLDAAPAPVRWERLPDGEAPPLPADRGQVVVGDGWRWWRGRDLGRAAAAGDDGRGARWHALDSAVLHEVWLPAAGVAESQITYEHEATTAAGAARERGGCAVLLHEVTLDDVVDIARSGLTMPRKSTSFGPKPPSGLVMRRHRES